MSDATLSVVIPVYNEAANVLPFYDELKPVIEKLSGGNYELLYVNDGSSDATVDNITKLHARNSKVKLLSLSRNFGKEMALAAGIASATGKAIVTMDGDGQHPADRLQDFVSAWQSGAQVVVGIREANSREGLVKRLGSKLFYAVFNRTSGSRMVPGSSDYRLIDREVRQAFIRLEEPDTITRGLIDWLGFERTYIRYQA